MAIFGKQGIAIMPVVGKGIDNLRQRMQEAVDMGAIVDGETATQAKQIKRTWKQLESAVSFTFLAIGEALLPLKAQTAGFTGQLLPAIQSVRRFLTANASAVQTAFIFGTALVGVSMALKAVAFGLGGISMMFSVMSAGIGLLVSGLSMLLSPIGLLTAGVAALGVVWATSTKGFIRGGRRRRGERNGSVSTSVPSGRSLDRFYDRRGEYRSDLGAIDGKDNGRVE